MWSVLELAVAVATTLAPAAPVEVVDATEPFRWNAPRECPQAEAVRAAIETHLGMPLAELSLASWSVVGRVVQAEDGRWVLDLSIRVPDGSTERKLHDPSDCAAVSDAAALLAALALDPEAVTSSAAGASSNPPPKTRPDGAPSPEAAIAEAIVPPPRPPITPRDPEREAGDPRSEPLHFVLGMAGGFDHGTLRRVSPIGRASFSWQLPRLRVGATATFGATPGFAVRAVAQEVSLWMWAAGAEVGPVFRVRAFEFPLTAGLEAGQLILRPRVLVRPSGHQVTWAALVLTPAVAWVPARWLALVLRVGTTVSFVRPEFAIEGIGRIHAPGPIGIRATLGVEFRFPLAVMKPGAGGNPLEP